MRKNTRQIGLCLLLPLLLMLAACDDQIRTLAKSLKATADAVSILQTTVIEGNKEGLISTDTTRTIMEISVKVSLAGKDAVAVTRNVAQLSSGDKASVLLILDPIINELASGELHIVDSIQDEKTRQKIYLTLGTIQTSLNSAKLIVAGGQ